MKLQTLRLFTLLMLVSVIATFFTHGPLAALLVGSVQASALVHLAAPVGAFGITRTTLSNELAAKTGFTDLIVLTYADLTEGDASQVIPILSVDPGDLITNLATKLVTPFDSADADIVSVAVTIGDGGSANRFLASQELCLDGTEIDFKAGVSDGYAYTAADTIDATVACTAGQLLTDVTSGELHIFIGRVRLNAIGEAID